ncbi:MAG: RlmE family RNA methyltransferase [Candidatus Poseidoniaceae archaeon]|nr:RlmE family RNA methyltransferase [Candidatus Poseidoniaceae archaeon]
MADRWVNEHKRDSWRRQAKEQGYRARSAWKLRQIQDRYRLLRKGDTVLDVGCHPGGWTQVAVEQVGEEGLVVGVDILPCIPVEGAKLLLGDITDSMIQEQVLEELGERPLNAIVSDISPDITGNWATDQAVSIDLVIQVLDFSLPLLCSGGSFVTKVFQGTGIDELILVLREHFSKVRRYSPEASRNSSSEVYVVCRNHHAWKVDGETLQERWERAVSRLDGGGEEDRSESIKGLRIVRRSSSDTNEADSGIVGTKDSEE